MKVKIKPMYKIGRKYLLSEMTSLSLNQKIFHAMEVISAFFNETDGNCYISFSGGLDSLVVLHLARRIYPDMKAVFIDTGQEFPEIRDFVKTFDNVEWIKPKKNFKEVIKKYGYPVISKQISMGIDRYNNTSCPIQKELRINGGIVPSSGKYHARDISIKWQFLLNAPFKISEKCCYFLKKAPATSYTNETKTYAITGERADESQDRRKQWIKHGCNVFDRKYPISRPLSIWNHDDVMEYIQRYKLPYCSLYDQGYDRTGCMFCMFGIHNDPDRFDRLKETHPKQYKYYMDKLGMAEVLSFLNIK